MEQEQKQVSVAGRILLNEVLSEIDLCEALNLKVDTLGYLRREKGFPFARVSKFDRVYLVDDVVDWLKKQKAQ